MYLHPVQAALILVEFVSKLLDFGSALLLNLMLCVREDGDALHTDVTTATRDRLQVLEGDADAAE